jgi:2-polyprenyl-3-methyl-5-hydroxy-6-metoxy-1,4-benzoquinol methylase
MLDRYGMDVGLAYDIGCGSGVLTCELAMRASRVIAIDGAAGMLEVAARSVAERGLHNVTFLQDRIPVKNLGVLAPADLVISSSVIEYLDSTQTSLAFLKSLLNSNGRLILSVSNRDSINRRLAKILYAITRFPKYIGLSRHDLTLDALKVEMELCGLRCLEYSFFDGADFLNRLISFFAPARFANRMILVVAQSA